LLLEQEEKATNKKEHLKAVILGLFLSKWFWYALVGCVLLSVAVILAYLSYFGNDLALRFLPTSMGLVVTIFIFTIFFEVREKLDFKSVELKVYEQIGRHAFDLFNEISKFCNCSAVSLNDEENFGDFAKRRILIQLPELVKKIEFNETGKKFLLGKNYLNFFEREENYLNNIETKYSKLLGSKLLELLMDMERDLHSIYLTIDTGEKLRTVWGVSEDVYFSTLSLHIGSLIREIDGLQKLGIPLI